MFKNIFLDEFDFVKEKQYNLYLSNLLRCVTREVTRQICGQLFFIKITLIKMPTESNGLTIFKNECVKRLSAGDDVHFYYQCVISHIHRPINHRQGHELHIAETFMVP